MLPYPDPGVEIYDLLHTPITRDITFYLKCAGRFGDPVFELGTGTARVLLPIVEAEYKVTGLDCSPQCCSWRDEGQ